MSKYEYIGPALLARALGDSIVRKFRGRILRHSTTGALRFYVNRTSASKVPKHWPGTREWMDDVDMKDIEWLGKRPENV